MEVITAQATKALEQEGYAWIQIVPESKPPAVLMLYYRSDSSPSDADEFYSTLEEALSIAKNHYGIDRDDWMTLEELEESGIHFPKQY